MNTNSISNTTNMNYGQIASGSRINKAADDVAGLAISNKMESQIKGIDAGTENASMAKNALNVADSALSGIQENLTRIQELSVKASNGLLTDDDKQIYQNEIDSLLKDISHIAGNTQFNEKKLLDGSMADLSLATNPNGGTMTIKMEDATLSALGLENYNVTGDFDMKTITDALERVTKARSNLGSASNALDYTMSYNKQASLEQTASQSRLADLDIPKAISEQKKNEVVNEYKTLMQKKQMEQESLVAKMFQ